MKLLNLYITEKLHLNKNLVSPDEELINKVKDIIIKYLEEHNWFDCYMDDFSVTPRESVSENGRKDLRVYLYYPQELSKRISINRMGVDLAVTIKKELHVDWEWSSSKDNCYLLFTNGI